MIDPKVFIGLPLNFSNICKIYPPTIGAILENEDGKAGYNLLTQTQEDIDEIIQKKSIKIDKVPTPFEFLLVNCYSNQSYKNLIVAAIKMFTKLDVVFVYETKMLIIGQLEEIAQTTDISKLKIITEDNFFSFQNMLRMAMGDKLEEYIDYSSMNPIVRKVKLAGKRRERIAAKSKKNKISLTTILTAICCMGIGITPLNIREMSYASASQIMQIYQQKEKYQTDISSLLAGADPKKIKPKYWVRENSDLQDIDI